jgi:rhodanese-related sulfurtransferase
MKKKFKTPDPKKARRYFARKLAFTTGPVEFSRWLKEREDMTLVDVRDPKSYAKGHIPGAVNLPKEKWHKTAALDKKKTNVVYGYTQTCHLAARAALEFASQGFPVIELEGGFEAWKDAGLDVPKSAARKPHQGPTHRPLAQSTEELAQADAVLQPRKETRRQKQTSSAAQTPSPEFAGAVAVQD